MAEIVLFHHVLGPTAGVFSLADDLRAAGHEVVLPDLFEGRRFSTIDEGAAYVDEIGMAGIIERGAAAVQDLPTHLVCCGISLGVVPAQYVAQTRPGTRGCIALEAFVPPTEFGDAWPPDVPLQIHGMADDPFFAGEGDLDAARSVVNSTPPGLAELFVYPGNHHLFVDSSLPAHDSHAATQVVDRMLAFLARIDRES